MKDIQEFNQFRKELNKVILNSGHKGLKRFWALDSQAYMEGALNEKTLEFMGLSCSIVLRCDDCVTYHLIRLLQLGASNQELYEAINVSLIIGGSITIPHIRRAFETLERFRKMEKEDARLTSLLLK